MKKPHLDQPLRITLYDPSGRGGVSQYTYFLAESLVRAGCRVTLLTSHDYELRDLPRQFDLVALFRPSWIRTIVSAMRGVGTRRPHASDRASLGVPAPAGSKERPELAWLRRARLRLLLLFAAARILATRSRILHVQWCSDRREDIRFIRLLKRLGVRTLYTAHDLLPHEGARSSDIEAFTELYQAVDQVVVLAEATRRELLDTFGLAADCVTAIAHGGDEVFSTPPQDSARQRLGIGADRRVILFFGTIRPYKGLEYLIQAFDRVRERVDNVLLLVAGGGSGSVPAEADYYSSVVAALRARADVVSALEYVPVADMSIYFSAADLVVLPYVRTYHSGVLMTAYAMGKPVVVTDTGGLAEAVEEGRTGFVVPPRDVDALAGGIATVLTMPDRGKAMGRRALELSTTIYSWAAVGERTAALYRRLLDRGGEVGSDDAVGADTSVSSKNSAAPAHTRAPSP